MSVSCHPSLLFLALFAVSAWAARTSAAAPDSGSRGATRPNVVILMPDDLSFDDFSVYNPRGPRTPHIDALSRQSVRLTDFHVSPTCSPTRAALMTGRYNNATGVWHTVMGRYFLRADEVTIADVFRANGYRTALFGKWHLGDNHPFRPRDRGFEHVVMFRGGGVDQQPDYWGNRNVAPSMIYENDCLVPLVDDDDGIAGAFSTNHFTSRAIDYMRDRAQTAEPFFAYIAYNVAHAPQDMPPDARPGIDARAATIENFDKNIGRLLQFLDESRLAANTLLIFFTDNGSNSARLRGGKSSHYDGGHRVPCFVRWPNGGLAGTEASARDVDRLVSHIDLLPTLMALLKLRDVPERSATLPLHGRSIASLLDRDSANDEPALLERRLVVDNQRMDTMTKYRQACVMRDAVDADGRVARKWRLTRASESQPWELHDVLADPRQTKNVANKPRHAALVQQLSATYEAWWTEVSARAGEYVRPMIGTAAEPVTCLYSHDWHADEQVPFNQSMVAGGMSANGINAVEFANRGAYTFDLRRWPQEIAGETTATSALRTPILDNKTNLPTSGAALPIHSARLRVWHGDTAYFDAAGPLAAESDGVTFTVPALPAGPALVQTWFYDAAGHELCGAYYNYVTAAR